MNRVLTVCRGMRASFSLTAMRILLPVLAAPAVSWYRGSGMIRAMRNLVKVN